MKPDVLPDDPLWYRDAIIYEVHVRAFFDTNGDGMGDFSGLSEKLDYLEDLGVTALWLLPFYPSPWHDDGYDIADYTDVHAAYGDINDFRRFLKEAHARGIRVITELVINHTSDQHPWFQRARRAKPGSSHRNYYVWSDDPEKYRDARIIFQDFEGSNWSWDSVAQQYFWHRFYAKQPDLNFDHPQVHKEVLKAMDFWWKMGVDGMRLDAIPYLYEREGTNCENLPESHAFLKKLRAHLDERYANRMLLAEANQWPEDAVEYLGDGDECHMNFHFPIMPRLFMSVQMEDRFPLLDILEQTPEIPENTQWAIFLRNHDELTLEMVTDEERDYMYRMYAHDPQMRINLGIRRRLAPLLGNNRRKIELLNGLLMSLPGTPVLYYGDEIGMGDNVYLGDRDGVRTPMQWSGDRNAGFSRANPQKLYLPVITDPEYHFEAINVEAQQDNPSSLLWWMKRLIALRKRFKAFSRGTIRFLHPENRKVLVFIREHEGEHIMVVANLSRFVQAVELDLSALEGRVPVELFGHNEFPRIGELPYFLTLGPHAFYWFQLTPERSGEQPSVELGQRPAWPALEPAGHWRELVVGEERARLADILPDYLRPRRWFGGKARKIRSARVVDAIDVRSDALESYIALVAVDYVDGDAETYVLPLAHAMGRRAEQLMKEQPHAVLARVGDGVLFDATVEPAFATELLRVMATRRKLRGEKGEVEGTLVKEYRTLRSTSPGKLRPTLVRVEQSNTSIMFGSSVFFKLFRKLEPGTNPDLEVARQLTRKGFEHTPEVTGELHYRNGKDSTLGVLKRYVPNEGDAWGYTLDALGGYFELVAATRPEPVETPLDTASLLRAARSGESELAAELLGGYTESARLLGQRTAEMHAALAAAIDRKEFAPEPFSALYQRSLYQSMRNLSGRAFQTLARRLDTLPEELRADAGAVLERKAETMGRMRAVVGEKMEAQRIRTHGDYHLGQVLYTGRDFVIIDFEGEPARPLTERRLKRSPLSDVAGMLRSFSYAAYTALADEALRGMARPGDEQWLEPWAGFWAASASAAFLEAYLHHDAGAGYLPAREEDLRVLLEAHLLEKAVYELAYELNNRPDWVGIPLRGIRQLLDGSG
ncbi:MAG TPA: maltose alpha-D-glucosyltransferase [Longimicrobiales bacterium]|nr:maltose alpha-D-glucosyltransferase [Longimicrobiales bacterium]